MMKAFNVLLVSRKKDVLDALALVLRAQGIAPGVQLNSNGHVDPLHSISETPDVVVLHLSHLWREELEAFLSRPAERRPALVLITSTNDMNVMRLAMQAGARDVLPSPDSKAELVAALNRIAGELKTSTPKNDAKVTAFINAKGGCGATLLACNVAHMLATEAQQSTALLDFDLQFGAAPLYLDLYPERGIGQALENLSSLDEVALEGYFTRHASGLHVLSHAANDPVQIAELPAGAADRLLEIASCNHEQIVVDLPRRADATTAAVLSRSHQVMVVLQQSVTALRDAARLLQWMRNDLALTRDQLTIVINRFEKRSAITLEDVQKALLCDDAIAVPNDFESASECVNTGVPLLTYARSAAITRGALSLQTRILGASAAPTGNVFTRTWSNLVSGRHR